MTTTVKAQISMDDRIIQDPELEGLLERRLDAQTLATDYRKADKKCKDRIKSMSVQMPFRVGRFLISKKEVPGRSVETKDSISIKIKVTSKA